MSVVLPIIVWAHEFHCRNIVLHIDNASLVAVVNKQTSKAKGVMQPVRQFVLLAMNFEVIFKTCHISSEHNSIADVISRNQWSRFRKLAPNASGQAEEFPLEFQLWICNVKLQYC